MNYEYDNTPLENEMNEEDFWEALRWQVSDETKEAIIHDINGPHVLITTPKMKARAEHIINEFKKCIDDDEASVSFERSSEVTTLRITILCDALFIHNENYKTLFESLSESHSINICESNVPGKMNIGIHIENFFKKIG